MDLLKVILAYLAAALGVAFVALNGFFARRIQRSLARAIGHGGPLLLARLQVIVVGVLLVAVVVYEYLTGGLWT